MTSPPPPPPLPPAPASRLRDGHTTRQQPFTLAAQLHAALARYNLCQPPWRLSAAEQAGLRKKERKIYSVSQSLLSQ
jgi:hypothetical protein